MKKKTNLPFNKSRLRSYIRREWLYSQLRRDALARARIERGIYQCEKCAALVGPKEIEVNHKIQVTPTQGLQSGSDWGILIERMLYCGPEGLEVLCSQCHKQITENERTERTKKKAKTKPKKS